VMKGALSPTSYHLAVVLLAYTNAAGDSARKRLNLLEEMFGDVEAKLDGKTDLSQDAHAAADQIREGLRELRDDYEPIIDLDPWAYRKLAAFEGSMTSVRTKIVKLIETYSLVEKNDISEVMLSPVLRRMQQ
jgi:hypothetical protein